jgi:hypothetical protein
MAKSEPREMREQRRAAELQQAQTRLERLLQAQQEDRASARERDILGRIGRAAGTEFKRGISDFKQATTSPFRLGRSAEFDAETTGTPAAVSRLQQLIREQALPEQQRALEQGRIALQQAGVRGPEAALMLQRQQNRLQSDLANRAEQVALQQALSDRSVRQQFASQRAMQEAAQARADRTAQQEFARQRALASQEKAFAKDITAEGRPVFDEQRQARSIDTFVNLPTEEKRKEAITQTGKGRVENTSGKTLEEASTIGRVSQPGRPSTEQELEQLRSQRSQGLTTLQKQQIIQQTMLGGGR